MAKGLKQLAKDTAVYGLSSIIGRFLNWMLVPMYTRVLTDTGEFGILTNLYSWTALLLVLLTYGMETGFFRFINKKEEHNSMHVYSTCLSCLAFTSVCFAIVVFIFLNPITLWLDYTQYPEFVAMMGVIVGLDAFCSLPFAYLRYQNKAARFAKIKLFNIGLSIFLNLFFLIACPFIYKVHPEWISWFYIPNYGVGYIFISNVFTVICTLLMLLPEIKTGFRCKPDFQLLKQILHYSFPILILGLAGTFNQNADKILFPFLFEDKDYADSQLGIYGACFKIAVVMVMFIQAFRYAYEPFVFAKNKSEDNRMAYIQAMKYFIIFGLLIFLGVVFYLDIIKYFIGSRYHSGLQIVPIVLLGELFFGIYFNLSIWYKLTDQTAWGAYFSIFGCLITVLIIILFVPIYGFMACAWASFFSNLIMMAISYIAGQKKYPIAYDVKSAITYGALTLVIYAAGTIVPIESIYIQLLYRTILLLFFIGFIVKMDLPLSEIPYIGRYFK